MLKHILATSTIIMRMIDLQSRRRIKAFLVALFLLSSLISTAQRFADSVYDKDSFSQLKAGKLKRDLALFTIAGSGAYKPKHNLRAIPVIDFSYQDAVFKKDSIKVIIRETNFIKSRHRLTFVDSILTKIDNKPFWGTDGGLPRTQIATVLIIVNKDTIRIPKSAYSDLYEPNFCYNDQSMKPDCSCAVFVSGDGKRLYIYMVNSDGAGTYEVTWIISNGKYLRRVVDLGS
jgi:hypothetical protein